MLKKKKPVIGLTMGDPNGIGPEIIVKALSELNSRVDWHPIVFGDAWVFEEIVRKLGSNIKFKICEDLAHLPTGPCIVDLKVHSGGNWSPGQISAWGGESAFRFLKVAIKAALANQIDAITTAPLSKVALHMAGHNFPGHTEILSALSNGAPPIMMLTVDGLRAVHVSTHIPLRKAIEQLQPKRILEVAQVTHAALIQMNIEHPRLALPGLNPHAGEEGLFGDEEREILQPALELIKNAGLNCMGPISPDTVFLRHLKGEFDAVIALYHDQSHIALKLLGFERGVNVTLGLPMIRTSVDHGTAFDRATQLDADSGSMQAAIDLALCLVSNSSPKQNASFLQSLE
jgi:4-hydroxythreonine-4-phosphate dehydrogenase